MNFLKEILQLKKRVPHKTNPMLESALRVAATLAGLNDPVINNVGVFGSIVFEVSTLRVRTLSNMKRKASARYSTHDIVGDKSVLEYVGQQPDEITFDVQLNAHLGVDVQSEITELLSMVRSGQSEYLILGDHAYGQYKWALEGVSFDHQYADRHGNPALVTATLTLKEDWFV